MPVPKKNHSKQRQDQRRANWKGAALMLTKCSNCSAMKRPHHVCSDCGYYNGRKILQVAANDQ